ncbi:MAG TPA: GNAT family N-acetyltransferase [Dehalococcoidales bacterium]|nr:GNAT family N-acetyltransferase [Dehalococcoidales bacterium]
MTITVKKETLDSLDTYRRMPELVWPVPFILPHWLKSWWSVFSEGSGLYLSALYADDKVIGIAPLRLKDKTAMFIGDPDVCDYVDFIAVPGREEEFCRALLDNLQKDHIGVLEMKDVRPDSMVIKNMVTAAKARGLEVVTTQNAVNVEMELPSDWELYLESLSTKQRHEARRKLRRLQESGNIEYHYIEESAAVPEAMDTFFKMFVESRRDKAEFLTKQREIFFKNMTSNMADAGLLKLGVLSLDGKLVAQLICFDYNNCVYLYNSGYEPDYVSLSVGMLSKTMAIKDAIEKGKKTFDFLKGAETYKFHLGGKEVPLYSCTISL